MPEPSQALEDSDSRNYQMERSPSLKNQRLDKKYLSQQQTIINSHKQESRKKLPSIDDIDKFKCSFQSNDMLKGRKMQIKVASKYREHKRLSREGSNHT